MRIQSSLSIFVFGALSFLTGCASITEGTMQKINIDTPQVPGATCYFQNDKGSWYLERTPGTVTVHRSYRDLIITTQKPGYEDSTVRIKSRTKGMVFGNVVFGGAVGACIDCANGSAYDYPADISIPMRPKSRH